MNRSDIILIGSGFMAREYLKVLNHLRKNVIVIGNGVTKVTNLQTEFPQFQYHTGGLEKYLENNLVPQYAINAVSINQLQTTSMQLLKAGVKYLLLEKPGALSTKQLQELQAIAKSEKAKVWIAYNRRFYASVQELQNQVEVDGGILSLHFEFTEWVHTIDPAFYDKASLHKWIIANSSHVIDTVFALIGLPKQLNTYILGKNTIEWHPSGSIFIGSGMSKNGIPFTYHSNWNAPGRWAIEVLTEKRRFFLKPMEKLQVQLKGSVQITEFPLNDQNDTDFKAGLLLQTIDFLAHKSNRLMSLNEQIKSFSFYNKIGSY